MSKKILTDFKNDHEKMCQARLLELSAETKIDYHIISLIRQIHFDIFNGKSQPSDIVDHLSKKLQNKERIKSGGRKFNLYSNAVKCFETMDYPTYLEIIKIWM